MLASDRTWSIVTTVNGSGLSDGRRGKRASIAAIVSQVGDSRQAGYRERLDTRRADEERSDDERGQISRVIAVIPAAVPTATASVGDISNAIAATIATATPRKIAGNTVRPGSRNRTNRVRERLGRQQDITSAPSPRRRGWDRRLAREEDVL